MGSVFLSLRTGEGLPGGRAFPTEHIVGACKVHIFSGFRKECRARSGAPLGLGDRGRTMSTEMRDKLGLVLASLGQCVDLTGTMNGVSFYLVASGEL